MEPSPNSEAPSKSYNLTIEQVVERFDQAGLPRSKRSIQRSCKRGHFDAILSETETGQRYFISEESVHRRIEELKQIMDRNPDDVAHREESRSDATDHDATRSAATSPAAPRLDATRPDTAVAGGNDDEGATLSLRAENKKLRNRIFHLSVDNRAKEKVMNLLIEERKTLLEQVNGAWERAFKLSGHARENRIPPLEPGLGQVDSATDLMRLAATETPRDDVEDGNSFLEKVEPGSPDFPSHEHPEFN